MEEIQDILATIKSPEDAELVQRAYELAKIAHEGQTRASGEPYITHCVAVARILSELRLDPATIAAGLLHDVVEDTILDIEDIKAEFGEEIANLVDGVTKLKKLDELEKKSSKEKESRAYEQAESIRKMFLAMVDDVRVVLIKLADRLHNMRTLGSLPEEKRKKIAQETLEIYAPLANRLGIWKMKWELEDLAFRYLEPEKYYEIARKLEQRRLDRERFINQAIEILRTHLAKAGIEAEITGRPKHIYSIYQKMKRKNVDLDQIYDLYGIRIIVKEVKDCYAALGVVHSIWPPIPGEFDDYIATPKDNMYRSLHTAVVGPGGRPMEVQIRTEEMHRVAEYGIAAHWRYKEGTPRDVEFENKIAWLRQILEWRREVTDAKEFVDSLKSDFFQDRVFVFTPKGDIIDLPAGSTPIDFAYHIHTELGHRCRGAKVNGKFVPLDYKLKNGDIVEIIAAKKGGPSRDWLNPDLEYVKTSRARQKIRLWFRKQAREESIAQGKALLDKELKKLGIKLSYEEIAKEFKYESVEDFLAAIGYGDLNPQNIGAKLLQLESQEETLKVHPSEEKSPGVTVLGVGDLLTHLAKCCNPVPGDEIIGYVTKGRGISIHRADCPNILQLKERERLIKVAWGANNQHRYPVTIAVRAFDREGLFRDIAEIVANEGVNIASAEITTRKKFNVAIMKATLEISSAEQLTRILEKISHLPNVIEAYRHTG